MNDTELEINGIPVSALAREFGTPLFVYDGGALTERFESLRGRLPAVLDLFYSLKANPNVSVCALLNGLGAGAEVSSMTELLTARRAGVQAGDIIFLGPGKSDDEIGKCLAEGIYAIVCESVPELERIDALAAAQGCQARVALRVNPAFTVKGSRLTMSGKPRQFGIDEEQLLSLPGLASGLGHVQIIGVHVYMGTRILSDAVVLENTTRILDLAERLSAALGFPLELVDIGGGLGVPYFEGEESLDEAALADGLKPLIEEFAARHPGTRLIMELGRYLTAPAGIYVIRVRYVKTSMGESFAVTDGGTHQHMAAVGIGSFVKRNFPVRVLSRPGRRADEHWTIAGPLCTPNDTLVTRALLPPVAAGDLIGVFESGAYGPTASPGLFLGHGHPAEVLVHGGRPYLIRERDDPETLMRPQRLHVFSQPARVPGGNTHSMKGPVP